MTAAYSPFTQFTYFRNRTQEELGLYWMDSDKGKFMIYMPFENAKSWQREFGDESLQEESKHPDWIYEGTSYRRNFRSQQQGLSQ